MMRTRLLRQIAAFAAICILASCGTPPQPAATVQAPLQSTAIAPPAALRLEGVPPLPMSLLQQVQRWSRVAGHGFVDWHPTRREMLLAHRAPGASTTQLWRLAAPMAPLEPLTDSAEPVTDARYEPHDGRYIVFERGRGGDEAYQVFRLDLQLPGSGPVQITPDGQRHEIGDWEKTSAGQAGPARLLLLSVPLDRTAQGGRRSELSTTLSSVDPLQPASRRVLAELPGGGWFNARVSPDGRRLALTRYVSAAESEVWLLDLAGGGQRRQLLPAPGGGLTATHLVQGWSADGSTLFVASDRAGEFRELLRVDVAGGDLTRLTADVPWDVTGASASNDGRLVATRVNADGRVELRLLNPQNGAVALRPAALPAGSVNAAEFHPALPSLAFAVNSARGPSQVHVLDAASGRVEAWTSAAGAEGLDLQSLPEQQTVRWTAHDGRTISGVLTLPPARFTGKRPVVMLVHGGPEAQSLHGWIGRWNILAQELGIAVLQPNVRGSSGYGKTFLALDNGRLREDAVKDLSAAIDWMANDPRLDHRRVLVEGGSYGGYMALAASTLLAERIAGAAASVGISNFVTFLENTESYRRDLRRVEYGDERDPAMRAFLNGISPLSNAARITKPLLVAQGRNDPRVPWTESEQIVRSLQARNTPVWYLLADNEGHGFARRENADFFFAALLQFSQRTLLQP